MGVTHNATYFIILLAALLHIAISSSYPIALQPDTTYQTGTQVIVTASFTSTAEVVFSIPYINVMTTASLNATLGIYGINYYTVGTAFGWKLYVASLTSSSVIVHLAVFAAASPIYYLKLCYLISSKPELDIAYVQYTIDPMTQEVANYALRSGGSTCASIDCWKFTTSQSYANKASPTVTTFLSGFQVSSFGGGGGNNYFGIKLSASSPLTTSFTMGITVYGNAQVKNVSFYYLSYNTIALNVLYLSAATIGHGSLGCYYPSNNCGSGGATSTTSFNTAATSVLAYNVNMFYMGIDSMIIMYTGNTSYKGEFDITGITQNSDSTIKVNFVFSGNTVSPGPAFSVGYTYYTFQTFYCPPGGPDYFFVNGDNKCDSLCGTSEYHDPFGICQPCDPTCYKCVGASDICTACYNSQNRVLVGTKCLCDPAGFYNDGTSNVCPSCHYSCLTCTGPGSSSCGTCDMTTPANRYFNVNTCPCLVGYYDASSKVCMACHFTCQTATCTGTSSTSCASCNAAKNRGVLTGSFTCPCAAGYYDNGSSSETCSPCHYSCLTCSTTNIYCNTCDATKLRSINSGSHTCPCNSGYYDPGVALCAACDSTCWTCSGALAINCLTCDPGVHRTKVVTSCPCANYFYDLNKVCTACYYSCLTCTINTSVGCSTCDSAVHRTYNATSGECYCSAGYVDVGVQTCAACYTGCLTCTTTATTCVTCHANPGRYKAGSSCLCQSNYVDLLFNGVCTLCHYSCLTCTSGTALGCATCPAGRISSSSSCVCPSGQYDNGFSVTCQTCEPHCLNCTTGLTSGCTACHPLYFRTLSPSPTGSCICQGGYYQVGVLLCSACDPKCLTCVTASTTCTSCDLPTNHRTITSGSTCDCAISYFETGAPACSPCTYPCYQCSIVSSNCTSCYSDRYLLNNACQCNAGTFQNLANTACPACAPSCLTCTTTLTTCLTCPANANRYQSGSSCPCNIGFYDNAVALCPPCSYTCYDCTSFAVCLSCPNSTRRTLTASACPCDIGYYDNGNKICSQCSLYCQTCSTYSQCQSCVALDNRSWNSAGLSCPCQAGFYDNGLNTTCSACHYSCATCFGGLTTNCNTCATLRTFTNPYSCPCNTGLYESGGVCTPCSITCLTCNVLSTNCTSCPATSYLSNYQCICLNGYFQNGLVCQICDVRCQWCSVTAANCLSCNPLHGTTISGSSCLCNSNQFQNGTSLVCTTCSPYCLTCSSSTNGSCLSCYSNMSRTLNAVSHTCLCSSGFYDSGALICSSCVSPCLTCIGGSTLNCTTCIGGYNLVASSCVPVVSCANYYYDGSCVNTCPNVTYTSVGNCLPCINNCLTCVSSSVCTSCLVNFYFYSGLCLGLCPTNTYSNSTDRSCVACPSACLQCSMRNSSVVCLSCNTNYYLLNSQCISLTNCPTSNQTYVLINNLCKPCLNGCATCANLTVNGCITCSTNFNYYQGMCLSNCPQGYYSLNQVCTVCMANCTSCSTKGCSICATGLYLNSQYQCVQIGYFLSQGSKVKCHSNCMTCTNSSFSSCILCVKYRGDASSKAISGYCDCWKGSIDLGGGVCDSESAKSIQKANEALVSASTSLNYLSALTGVICINYFAPVMIASYQQLYSNFYYLNSSSVLQTDELLNNYGDTCFNKLMQKETNKDVKKQSKAFGRRLQATTQLQESLFMRGYSWKYLVDWGFYTFICVIVAWLMVLLLTLVSWKVKACISKENIAYRILNGVFIIFKENIIIVLHILTINDVSLYGLASFKLLPQMATSIDPLLMTFSIIMFSYYIIYLLRLFIAAIRFVGSEQQQNQFMVLFSCFYSYRKKQALCRIYVPMMMLRSFIISIALVFLAFTSIGQVVTALLVFIIFTIYSFLYCPYYFYLTVFVHIFESIFIIQLLLLTISVAQPDASRIGPAFGLIVLNYMQLASFLVLTVCIVLNKIYDIKCWQLKQKRILPFKQQTENEEVHVPVYKGKYPPIKIHQETIEDMVVDETLTDQKMDNDILRALHRRVGVNHKDETKIGEKDNVNASFSSIRKPTSEIPRRRRKAEVPEEDHVDIFSLQDMKQSPKKNQRSSLRPLRRH